MVVNKIEKKKVTTPNPLDINIIREAINRHRGGWASATDTELRRFWNSLPATLQAEYLKPLEVAQETNDAERVNESNAAKSKSESEPGV